VNEELIENANVFVVGNLLDDIEPMVDLQLTSS
jgi:hypothetical protein